MLRKLFFGVFLLGTLQVQAKSLNKEGIRDTIRKHLGEVRGCYEKMLPTQPGLSGKIVVDFTIGEQGHIVASKVNAKKSTIHNEKLNDCVRTTLGSWTFPSPPVGQLVEISYPFFFSAGKTH